MTHPEQRKLPNYVKWVIGSLGTFGILIGIGRWCQAREEAERFNEHSLALVKQEGTALAQANTIAIIAIQKDISHLCDGMVENREDHRAMRQDQKEVLKMLYIIKNNELAWNEDGKKNNTN